MFLDVSENFQEFLFFHATSTQSWEKIHCMHILICCTRLQCAVHIDVTVADLQQIHVVSPYFKVEILKIVAL